MCFPIFLHSRYLENLIKLITNIQILQLSLRSSDFEPLCSTMESRINEDERELVCPSIQSCVENDRV